MGLGEADTGWRTGLGKSKADLQMTEHETKAKVLLQPQAEIVRLVGEFNLFYRTDDPDVEQMYRAAWMLTKGGNNARRKDNGGL